MAVTERVASVVANVAGAELPANQEWLREQAEMDPERVQGYERYSRYYDGNHRTKLTTRAREYLQACGLPFAENFCEIVVDSFAERMLVTGFGSDDPDLAEWCSETFWEQARMDAKQGVVHTVTPLKGDGFLIADLGIGRDGRPTPKLVFNQPDRMKMVYDDDDPDVKAYAVKTWDSSSRGPSNPFGVPVCRMNIYFPDRIEKYFTLESDGRNWARWLAKDGAWPTPWTRPNGSPRGVAAFHFRHKSRGRQYGRSRLHGTLPQQDAFNKSALDLFMVLDNLGFDRPWVTSDADVSSFTLAIGELWKFPADASVGVLEGADPVGLLKSMEAQLQRIGGRSRTPMHMLWLTGDAPTGEALKTTMEPLTASIVAEQTPYGNEWEDAAAMCATLAVDYKLADLNLDALGSLSALWDDPTPRNAESEMNVAEAKIRVGVSRRTVVRELGYDPEDEAEQRALEADSAAEAAMKAFSAGRGQQFGGGPAANGGES